MNHPGGLTVAGVEAAILGTDELKRDLLVGVVQLELGRIETDATRAAKGKGRAADALHPGLADLDPERLALGGASRGGGAGSWLLGHPDRAHIVDQVRAKEQGIEVRALTPLACVHDDTGDGPHLELLATTLPLAQQANWRDRDRGGRRWGEIWAGLPILPPGRA